jgi:hypothetical protein
VSRYIHRTRAVLSKFGPRRFVVAARPSIRCDNLGIWEG